MERCIPQSRVGHWPPAVMAKVLPDIYSYWVAKRNFLGKQNYIYGRALARKYWIPTAAGDTNPHHTFRVRDKEKYRLRRQQKRNDLESFRKLQQIRREFGQARVLTQLVIEREKCREAALEVATQVFEQRLFDAGLASLIPPPAPVTTAPVSNTVAKPVAVGDSAAKSGGNSTSSVPRRCATPYKHSLIYEHLLFAASAPYSFDKSMLPSPSGASASYSGTGIAGISGLIAKKRGLVGLGDSLGFSTNKMRGMKKIGVAGVPGVPGVPSDKKLKRKRNLEGFLAGGTSDDQSSEFVVGSLSTAAVGVTASPLSRTADASESGTGAGGGGGLKSSATFEASDEHLTALNSQYGTVTLASSFPSFMERSDLHGADVSAHCVYVTATVSMLLCSLVLRCILIVSFHMALHGHPICIVYLLWSLSLSHHLFCFYLV